jgi:hypothetical protein
MKTHLYDKALLVDAPPEIINKYKAQGLDGTLCRRVLRVTTNINHVTCGRCLQKWYKLEENKNE